MTDWLPRELEELDLWLKNFEAVARSYRGLYGLDDRALGRIAGAREQLGLLSGRLRQSEGAAAEARGAAERAMAELVDAERSRADAGKELAAALDARRAASAEAARAVRPVVDLLQRRRQARAGAASSRRASGTSSPALSSSGRISSSSIRLAAPAELAATAHPNRVNHLSWRGTGEPGARYLIEASVGKLYRGSPVPPESAGYRLVATVSDETTYQHAVGQAAPGVHVKYRVRVARDSLTSDYSAEVTVACK
ncbi:uncharacterized protein SOCE26_057180 [Sorangium cellulosum]|uniref:Uncharacterized protein n=1 Tax=Sorangium cellulosum TaxID=56 RepID=A0A2L0EY60_SORCE|nr:hypothetical protein [Sorangium cellulosum]AUX44254.1 uncharacterized protein SOCE26_057180 [Sorangium cellulosum]